MIDFLNPDYRTISLLQGIKDSYCNKDNVNIFCDWMEENEEKEYSKYIRNDLGCQSNQFRKNGGRWLGAFWKESMLKISNGLIWGLKLDRHNEDYYEFLNIMNPWIGDILVINYGNNILFPKVSLNPLVVNFNTRSEEDFKILLNSNIKGRILITGYQYVTKFYKKYLANFLDRCSFDYVIGNFKFNHPKYRNLINTYYKSKEQLFNKLRKND